LLFFITFDALASFKFDFFRRFPASAPRLLGESTSVGIDDVDGSLIFNFIVGVDAASSDDAFFSVSFMAATFGVIFVARFDVAAEGVVDGFTIDFSSALKSVSRSDDASSLAVNSSFDETSFSLDELNLGLAVPAVTPRPVSDV
jgi:hypothetical protein